MIVVDVVVNGKRRCVLFTVDSLDIDPLFSFDSRIAYSAYHAAKAIEVTLYSHKRGDSLRNLKLEFYRRLLSTKEVRKLPFNLIKDENCKAYVIDCEEFRDKERWKANDCLFRGQMALDFYRKLYEITGSKDESRIETLLISLVEATKIGRWFTD